MLSPRPTAVYHAGSGPSQSPDAPGVASDHNHWIALTSTSLALASSSWPLSSFSNALLPLPIAVAPSPIALPPSSIAVQGSRTVLAG